MDDLGFNKIAAAVLATALGFMLIKEVPHMLMHSESPDIPAYALEIPDVGADGGEAVDVPFPSPAFIAALDSTRGEKVFKKCQSCHNADKGGPDSTGPNLYGVVGKSAGTHASFKYSSAMTSSGITWNYEELNEYLTKPGKYVSGTAMNFVGLKKEEDRAAVIEYLRQASDNPVPQPVAAAAPIEEAVPVIEGTAPVVEEPQEDGTPQDTVPEETVQEDAVPATPDEQ